MDIDSWTPEAWQKVMDGTFAGSFIKETDLQRCIGTFMGMGGSMTINARRTSVFRMKHDN